MPSGPLEIKDKSYLTDAPPSDMPYKIVKLYQPKLLHCQYKLHTVQRVVMSLQTCLLVSATVRWMLLDHSHSISIPADILPLNIACLMALCFSFCYTCWYGVSLSAVSAGLVSHYKPCLLVWCLIISCARWYGASLKIMLFDLVPHYLPCLLVWCLTIGHAFWCDVSL